MLSLDSDDTVIAQLIRMQYQAQKQGYQQDYPDADYYVIEWQGEACGRLILDQRKTQLQVVDIAVLKQRRNHGIGSAIFNYLQQQSRAKQQILYLNMNPNNQGLKRFYQRLGFKKAKQQSENPLYQTLCYF